MLRKHFSAPINKLLHAEWLVLWGCFVATGMILTGYPLLLPSLKMGEIAQMLTVTQKYSTLLGVIFGFYLFSMTLLNLVRRNFNPRKLLADIFIFARLLLCLFIAIYLMQAFKWWSQMQAIIYDDVYWQVDMALQPVKDAMLATETLLEIPQIWYFYGFSYFFMIPYLAGIMIVPDMFLRLATANMAVMVLGGIMYGIAPAYGPLIHSFASDPLMADAQYHMLEATNAFRNSNFHFDATAFDAVLGAMPSLHVAHITAIVMVIWHYCKPAAILCIPPMLFIFAYSIVTHFHYLIDIPAGLLLAFMAVYISGLKLKTNAVQPALPAAGSSGSSPEN